MSWRHTCSIIRFPLSAPLFRGCCLPRFALLPELCFSPLSSSSSFYTSHNRFAVHLPCPPMPRPAAHNHAHVATDRVAWVEASGLMHHRHCWWRPPSSSAVYVSLPSSPCGWFFIWMVQGQPPSILPALSPLFLFRFRSLSSLWVSLSLSASNSSIGAIQTPAAN